MFKQISNVHTESINDSDWSSFLKLEKQDKSMRSAYVDKVRISWVCLTGVERDTGILFVASHDNELDSSTPSNNDGNIIAASASRGAGGVVTLDIKRRITMDYDSADASILELLKGASGAPIYLHAHKANNEASQSFYLVIETFGRWFTAESL